MTRSRSPENLITAPAVPHDFSWIRLNTVRIYVGKSAQRCDVLEDIIVLYSAWFKHILSRPAKKSERRDFVFEQVDPEAFELYLKLIYDEEIPLRSIGAPNTAAKPLELQQDILCKLYVVAGHLDDKITQDLAHSTLMAHLTKRDQYGSRQRPSLLCVTLIYKDTSPGDPDRTYVIDWYVKHGDKRTDLSSFSAVPKEFYLDLSAKLLSTRHSEKLYRKALDQARLLEEKYKALDWEVVSQKYADDETIDKLRKENKQAKSKIEELEAARVKDRTEINNLWDVDRDIEAVNDWKTRKLENKLEEDRARIRELGTENKALSKKKKRVSWGPSPEK